MKHDACLFREVVGAVIKRIQNQIQGVKSWSMWRILHKIRIQFLYNIKVKAINLFYKSPRVAICQVRLCKWRHVTNPGPTFIGWLR